MKSWIISHPADVFGYDTRKIYGDTLEEAVNSYLPSLTYLMSIARLPYQPVLFARKSGFFGWLSGFKAIKNPFYKK